MKSLPWLRKFLLYHGRMEYWKDKPLDEIPDNESAQGARSWAPDVIYIIDENLWRLLRTLIKIKHQKGCALDGIAEHVDYKDLKEIRVLTRAFKEML